MKTRSKLIVQPSAVVTVDVNAGLGETVIRSVVGGGRVSAGTHAFAINAPTAARTAAGEPDRADVDCSFQSAPSTPMLGIVTGPIAWLWIVSFLKVAFMISATNASQ